MQMKKNQISEIHGTSLGTCNSFSNSAQQQNETEGKKKYVVTWRSDGTFKSEQNSQNSRAIILLANKVLPKGGKKMLLCACVAFWKPGSHGPAYCSKSVQIMCFLTELLRLHLFNPLSSSCAQLTCPLLANTLTYVCVPAVKSMLAHFAAILSLTSDPTIFFHSFHQPHLLFKL